METSLFSNLNESIQDALVSHLKLVIKANESVNLTRIDTLDEGILLHIEDSLAALDLIEEAPEGAYGDLGSGGGFPGIPLAIASGRDTTLIDARKKKMDALNVMIEELGQSDHIHTFAGRAELLARKQPESFAVLTARALAKLSVLLELASPLLQKNGVLICYKANMEEDELSHALSLEDKLGMKLIDERQFELIGDENYHRSIYTFKKVKKAKVSLPRQEGAAQKNPF